MPGQFLDLGEYAYAINFANVTYIQVEGRANPRGLINAKPTSHVYFIGTERPLVIRDDITGKALSAWLKKPSS